MKKRNGHVDESQDVRPTEQILKVNNTIVQVPDISNHGKCFE